MKWIWAALALFQNLSVAYAHHTMHGLASARWYPILTKEPTKSTYIPVGTVGVGLVCVGMTVVVTESSTVCSENKIMQH